MAPDFSRILFIDIDQDWAQSLKGLKVKVPSSWRQGCGGGELNAGAIVAVDFSKSNQRYFHFLLDANKDETEDDDNLPGLYYPMRYNDVFYMLMKPSLATHPFDCHVVQFQHLMASRFVYAIIASPRPPMITIPITMIIPMTMMEWYLMMERYLLSMTPQPFLAPRAATIPVANFPHLRTKLSGTMSTSRLIQ